MNEVWIVGRYVHGRVVSSRPIWINTLRSRQNRRHFADNIFKYILFNETVWIPIEISLTFVSYGPIDDKSTLVQVKAWRRTGDKSLPEPTITQSNNAYMHHPASMS